MSVLTQQLKLQLTDHIHFSEAPAKLRGWHLLVSQSICTQVMRQLARSITPCVRRTQAASQLNTNHTWSVRWGIRPSLSGGMMQGELTGGRILPIRLDRLRVGAWICHSTSHMKAPDRSSEWYQSIISLVSVLKQQLQAQANRSYALQ